MRGLVFGVVVLLAAGLFRPGNLHSQVFNPILSSPRPTNDLGVVVNDGPGRFSAEALWRGGPYGLRVGYVDAAGGLLSLGGEFRRSVPIPDAPLGLIVSLAAQTLLGDENAYGAQAGLSGGYVFQWGEVRVVPYLHPRVAAVRDLGNGREFVARIMADLGIDVEVQDLLIVRLGVTLRGIGANVGVGLALRQ
jgi:hypothetical protein